MSTEDLPIGGGRGFPASDGDQRAWAASLAQGYRLEPRRAEALLARYGTAAEAVAAYLGHGSDRPLRTLPGYTAREILYLATDEPMRRLADLLLRRTTIAMEGLLTTDVVEEVAELVAQAQGWNAERMAQEIAHTSHELDRRTPAR